MVHHIENNQINSEIENNKGLVIVDFFATWCMPCQMLAPVLEEMDKKYEDVTFYKVNIDENQESAMRYQVVSVPTVIFIKEGKEVERSVGYIEADEFSEIIENLR